MSERASVLYDIPGPKAKRVNLIMSVVFGALLLLLAWYVLTTLASKNQLTADKWSPFLESDNWTTYLLPGLWATLYAAAVSVVIALPIGAILGIGRLSDHAWIRWPVGVIVEFFRSIPVIILMLFAFELWFFDIGLVEPVRRRRNRPRPVQRLGAGRGGQGGHPGRAEGPDRSRCGDRTEQDPADDAGAAAAGGHHDAARRGLQLVVIVKDTALGGILVGYVELRRAANTSASNYGNLLPTYVVVAVIYIIINMLLNSLSTYLERKLRTRRGGRRVAIIQAGTESDLLERQEIVVLDAPGVDEFNK